MTTSPATHRPQLLYLHLLRILGAIGVVALHSSSTLVFHLHTTPPIDWWNTNIINAFFRWVVPGFILASGTIFLTLSKTDDLKTFYTKRFMKIGTPFIFWFVFYYFWKYKTGILDNLSFDQLYKHIIYDPPQYHLYFLFIITALYAATPFIKRITQSLTQPQIGYLLILLGLYTITWRYHAFTLILWLPYVFFFVFPCIASYLKSYISARTAAIGFLVSSVSIAFLTYYRFLTYHGEPEYFYGYTNPLVVLQAVSLFMLFYQLEPFFERSLKKHESLILWLSNKTFGVYLLALCFQETLWQLFETYLPNFKHTIITTNVHILISLILSFSAVTLIQKIPLLKKTV